MIHKTNSMHVNDLMTGVPWTCETVRSIYHSKCDIYISFWTAGRGILGYMSCYSKFKGSLNIVLVL